MKKELLHTIIAGKSAVLVYVMTCDWFISTGNSDIKQLV